MADIRQGYERLTADPGLQTRFPTAAVREPEPVPAGPSALASAGGLFWVVLAVLVAALLAVAVRAVLDSRRPRLKRAGAKDAAAAGDVAVGLRVPVSALADADALAAAGQYGAAVHALLLRGVAVIQKRFPGALGPALTSRDIAALSVLPPALRTAFSGIAARTERAVFAQAPLGPQDWQACRALYAGLLPAGKEPGMPGAGVQA